MNTAAPTKDYYWLAIPMPYNPLLKGCQVGAAPPISHVFIEFPPPLDSNRFALATIGLEGNLAGALLLQHQARLALEKGLPWVDATPEMAEEAALKAEAIRLAGERMLSARARTDNSGKSRRDTRNDLVGDWFAVAWKALAGKPRPPGRRALANKAWKMAKDAGYEHFAELSEQRARVWIEENHPPPGKAGHL